MRLTAFLIPALAAFVPALAQNETDTEGSGYVSNVLEALNGAGLTTLAGALTALAATPAGEEFLGLLEQGNKTVFAPSNEAFEALGADALEDLDLVSELLAYHIVDQDVTELTIGVLPNNTAVETLRGEAAGFDLNVTLPLILTRPSEDEESFVIYNNNDTIAVEGPTEVENLQVYVIDSVISLPATLEEVVESSGLTSLAPLLEGLNATEGPLTIFAPNDAAFEAIASDLEGLDEEQVTAILSNHIVNGTVFSEDIVVEGESDDELTPLAGPAITVTTNETGTFVTSGDASAQVVGTDLLFDGGVVHIIDSVLVNESPEENEPVTSTPGTPSPTGSGSPESSGPAEESDAGNPAGKLELSFGVALGGLFVTLGAIAGGGLLAF